jgi:hypothetical protein
VLVGGSVGGSQSASEPSSQLHTPAPSQSSPLSKFSQKDHDLGSYSVPAQHPSVLYCGDGVGSFVGGGVGGVHSSESGSSVTNQVHSSAVSQAYSLSSIVPQNDHVIGEFPVQHPGCCSTVGAGVSFSGVGSGVTLQRESSAPASHEQTPAASHALDESIVLQNVAVAAEYPVQHPISSVGSFVGGGVGG